MTSTASPATDAATDSTASPARRVRVPFLHHYVVRRIGKSIVTLWLVVTASFFLVRFMPGNPTQVYINNLVGSQGMSYESAKNQAASLVSFDSDQPMLLQYLQYLGNLLHGNLGMSITSPGTSVTSQILAYIGWTVFSVGLGTVLAFAIGAVLGIVAAYRRGRFIDHLITNVSSILHAVPNYVWAMVITVVFGVQLGWFDITSMRGTHTPGVQPGLSPTFISDALYHATLPVLVYVLTSTGGWVLAMKSSTVQVLEEDFVVIAKARGLRGWRIRLQYIGRNAILPLFTTFGISIGGVVGGSVLIETLFQYNGVGYYLYDAITNRDYPVMQGFILVITASVIAANLIADLLLSRIDPRIRVGSEAAR